MSSVINDFLRRCLKRVADRVHPITVVQGNEGGDMDSIVGSVYLAMLFDRHAACGVENPVPAVNFPLEDLSLRNDVARLLQEVGVDVSLLLSVQPSKAADRVVDIAALDASLFLHDHNRLRDNQSAFEPRVVGIVDHHADEKKNLDLLERRRVIKPVGSACTLVAEAYHVCEEEVPCPQLLIAPIVLDTVNFDPAQKKVTPEDVAMYQWLCRHADNQAVDSAALYKKLSEWKDDVLSLTVAENLRRDFKKFDFKSRANNGTMATGTSSVPCSCHEFEAQYTVESIAPESVNFIKEHKLDILIFAFAGKVDGKYTRDVAFCATPEIMEAFAPFIADTTDGISFTKTTQYSITDKSYIYESYSLSDSAVSRKKLVPALRKFLAEGGTRSLL